MATPTNLERSPARASPRQTFDRLHQERKELEERRRLLISRAEDEEKVKLPFAP